MEKPPLPTVMTFSGADPTGGAGIAADITAIASQGCHAAPVITAIVPQDTQEVKDVYPLDAAWLVEQARAVLEDMPVAAFKLGLVGSVQNVEAIHTLLVDYPDPPVVLDPVLASGHGRPMADDALMEAMRTLLFPRVTVLTPNTLEARRLAPEADDLESCAQELMDQGCEFVLITGAHELTPKVINALYSDHRLLETFSFERLPGSYHGSGCTLASAIAGLLAQGQEPFTAVHEAQAYTHEALRHATRQGMGQLIPNRLFWGWET